MDNLSFNLKLSASYNVVKKNAGGALPPTMQGGADEFPLNFVFGTSGAGKGNVLMDEIRTIAAAGTDDIDLSGVEKNNLYEVVSPVRIFTIEVYLINVQQAAAFPGLTVVNASSITIGAFNSGGSGCAKLFFNTATSKHDVPSGGFYAAGVADNVGVPVTNSTADKLEIVNNDGSKIATYRIRICGRSS